MPAPLAAALVVLSSAAVLVLEVLVSRLVAPYVGLTLETYTAAIGVALAAIAAGASWGGRLADRVDPRRWIGPAVALGGALLLAARLGTCPHEPSAIPTRGVECVPDQVSARMLWR